MVPRSNSAARRDQQQTAAAATALGMTTVVDTIDDDDDDDDNDIDNDKKHEDENDKKKKHDDENGANSRKSDRNDNDRKRSTYYYHYDSRLNQARLFYSDHCIYLLPMLGWFFFSAALSTYNKYVFGETHMNFQCPLLMTSIHFLLQWGFSHFLCEVFPMTFGLERLKGMRWKEWSLVSIPCGVVTSGDVGLSNLSLVRITMTFYTMVKSATPIFVLAWAYLFGIEQITYSLVLVVLIIAFGELLTVMGEVDFDHIGFLLCLSAAVLSGARWTLVQLKLRSMEPPIKSTIATMKLLSPSMFFSLLAFSLAFEKPWEKVSKYNFDDYIQLLVLGLVGGSLAISMVLCEFHLIINANAFILMIGGVIKEMVTIMVGIFLFGDKLNLVNSSGVFVVFLGVFCYKLIHYWDGQKVKHQVIVGVEDSAEADTPSIRNVCCTTGEDGGLLILRRDHQTKGIELPKHASISLFTGSSTHRHRETSFA